MYKWINNNYEDDIWRSEDEFDSREEAIADGIRQYNDALNGDSTYLFDDDYPDPPSGVFYIGEAVPYYPDISVWPIIENVQEDAYWNCGEVAECFLDFESLSDDIVYDLKENLQREFDSWLKRHHLYPSFFTVENVEKIDLNKN